MNALLLAVALTSSVVCREPGRYDAWPSVTCLKDGKTLVAVYGLRRNGQGVGEFAAFSSDGGHTWSAVDSFCLHRAPEDVAAGDIGYPATVLLADGCLYTVFYEPEQKDGKPCIWGVRWQAPESAR